MSAPLRGRFSGLRVRLLVVVALAVAPALVVILRAGSLAREAALEHADESAVRLAQLAAVQGNQVLSDAAPYVQALARTPAVAGGTADEQRELFARVLAEVPLYANAGLIGPDGSVRASALAFDPATNLADREYFRRAMTSGAVSIGRCQFGRIAKEPTINMAAPVRDAAGATTGVVYVAIRLDWLPRFEHEAKLPAGAAITLLDDAGVVVARFPDPEGLVQRKMPDAPLVRAVLASGEGRGRIEGLTGRVRPYAWAPLRWGEAPTGSFIAVGVSATQEIAAADAAQTAHLVALAAAAALAFAVAWLVGGALVVRPARALVAVTQRIRGGALDARSGPPYGRGEIAELAASVDSMAEALEKRDAELRRAEARYRSLVEQTPAVFYTAETDSAARTVFCGPGVRTLLGFAPDDWRGDAQLWSKCLHPHDKLRVALEYGRAVAAGGSFALEYRLSGKDGAPVWVRDSGTVRLDSAGTTRVTGLIVDVTEVRELHARMLRERQLDAAARLASAVAREIDDAAASVRRHTSSLRAKAEGDAAAKGHVDGVLRALDRVAALTRRLASFAGGLELEPEVVNVCSAVVRLLPEFQRIAGEGTEVVALPVPGDTFVTADPRQLDETLLRMAALARKAMPRGGHMVVGTAVIAVDEDAARRHVGARPGQYVIAFVGESGAGGAASVATWIIDLEAGAEPATRAASLEHAAVLGFALQSGGYADVVTAAAKGTTYRLFLPKADLAAGAADGPAPS
jgi:PAS domain S-box-containing protein